MAIGKDLRRISNNYKRLQQYVDKQTKLNVKHACYEMVARAKERTPPHEGEERGKNTVTGNMARHWDSNYTFNNGSIKVTLYNNVQYASYVENGHKMTKHFVPWLYIDGTNTIARHQPAEATKRSKTLSWLFDIFFRRKRPNPGEPLFGLVVGTKTKYVPPEHIVDQAKERFFEAYSYMRSDMIHHMIGQIEE